MIGKSWYITFIVCRFEPQNPPPPSHPLATSLYLFFSYSSFFTFFGNSTPMKYGKTKINSWGKVISSCLQDYKISFFVSNSRLTLIWNSEMITRHPIFELTHPHPHPKNSTSLAPSTFYLKPSLNKGVELILWCFRRQISLATVVLMHLI